MNDTHLRIAITTNSLIDLDANFVAARQMVFYDVSEDASEFVDVVHFSRSGKAKKGPGGGVGKNAAGGCVMDDMEDDDGTGHDPMTERVASLAECSVLFTMGLSDLAAVRVHAIKVFPVKSEKPRPIDDVIANVQRMMQGNQPLWLRRLLRDGSGNRIGVSADLQEE